MPSLQPPVVLTGKRSDLRASSASARWTSSQNPDAVASSARADIDGTGQAGRQGLMPAFSRMPAIRSD